MDNTRYVNKLKMETIIVAAVSIFKISSYLVFLYS